MATLERSSPKPEFTDAEAGAKDFPDSTAAALQLLHAAEAQAVALRGRHRRGAARPAALPRPGLALRVLRRPRRLPARLDRPEGLGCATAGTRSASRAPVGRGYDWPAHGWHEFRDPNEEWELTLYRNNANVVRQINQNIDTARETKAFEQWNPNWVTFVERNVGAWMHVEHGLGPLPLRERPAPRTNEHAQQRDLREQHAPDPVRPGPGALQPDAERGDRVVRRCRPCRDVEQRPGLAGRTRGLRGAHRRSTTGPRPSLPPTSSSSR